MEFSCAQRIQGVGAHVFDSPTCPYDIILGQDFLQSTGFDIHFFTDTMPWLYEKIDIQVLNRAHEIMNNPPNGNYFDYESYVDELEFKDKFLCNEAWDNFSNKTLGRAYT